MLPRLRLKSLLAIVAVIAVAVACWVGNPTRFGWTTACEWHSFVPIPGYADALDHYRAWLAKNDFQECESPSFGLHEREYADTKWFRSTKYREIFVLTSGDQQNVIANVVVRVNEPLLPFRATQSELKDYTKYVSAELHALGHPMLEQ